MKLTVNKIKRILESKDEFYFANLICIQQIVIDTVIKDTLKVIQEETKRLKK